MQRPISARVAAVLLTAGMACGSAMAQDATSGQVQPLNSPSAAQLDKYAGAVQKVAMVADEYRPKVSAAQDDAARQAVLEEADQKMVRMVQADGLSVEEYNGISEAVRQDPQLRERVVERINAQAPQGGGTGR